MSSPRKQLNDQAYDPLTTYGTGSNLDYQISNAKYIGEFKSVSDSKLAALHCLHISTTLNSDHMHCIVRFDMLTPSATTIVFRIV